MSPTILTGAASSNNIGWDMKILRDLAQINLISSLDRANVLGFFLDRPAATSFSIIASKSTLRMADLPSDFECFEVDGGGRSIGGSSEAFGGAVVAPPPPPSGDLPSSSGKGSSLEFVEEGDVDGDGVEDENGGEAAVLSLMEYRFFGGLLNAPGPAPVLLTLLFDDDDSDDSDVGVKHEFADAASSMSDGVDDATTGTERLLFLLLALFLDKRMGKGSGSSDSADEPVGVALWLLLSLFELEEELLHEFRSFLLGEFPMVHRAEGRDGGRRCSEVKRTGGTRGDQLARPVDLLVDEHKQGAEPARQGTPGASSDSSSSDGELVATGGGERKGENGFPATAHPSCRDSPSVATRRSPPPAPSLSSPSPPAALPTRPNISPTAPTALPRRRGSAVRHVPSRDLRPPPRQQITVCRPAAAMPLPASKASAFRCSSVSPMLVLLFLRSSSK